MTYEIKYRKKEGMKDSGIEWLGKVPNEWQVTRLKHKSKIIGRIGFRGYTVDDIVGPSEGAITLSPSNIHEQKLMLENNSYISWSKFHQSPEIKIYNGDVLLVKTASIGKVAYVENLLESATINPQFVVFKNIKLNTRLFYYYMISKNIQDQVQYVSNGGVVSTLTQKDIGDFRITFMDMYEQQKVANFLEHKTSEFDSIISKKEILIEKLEKAKKSLISEVVTGKVKIIDGELVKREAFEMKESGIEWLGMIPKDWEVKKLKYYTTKTGSGKTPRGGSEVYLEEGIPFLRSQNIYDDGLRLDDVVFISDRINREMINSIVIKGDILLNITGASIGRCCLYNLEKNANVNQHVCIVRLQDKSTYAKLMELLLQSNVVQDYINSCQTGSSREGLNFEQIKNIVIPISKDKNDIRDMATKIDNKVIAINSIITKTKLQIKKLKQAKQSLISECVTGKIDLRDWEIREI